MDINEEERQKILDKVNKLRQSNFKQQTLPAWRPIPSFRSTMITFTVFGIIFLGLGILLYVMSDQISEKVVQYDDLDICKKNIYGTCQVEIEIKEKILAPVYVYYQLDNFYQNHRRYVKSRSFKQLQGNYLPVSDLGDCDPIKTIKDLRPQIYQYADKKTNFTAADDGYPAVPCGLVAKSVFNDTYELRMKGATTNVVINEKDIAWESDKKYKFKNLGDENGNVVINGTTKNY